jgi:DivIVA domain-containing protein
MEPVMLTPQAIKDQDFQIKFRGYDAIEVKAYLELLAEDFFELTEQNRLQMDEIESLRTEREVLQREKDSLAAEMRLSQENAETIQSQIDQGYKHKDKEISELRDELGAAQASAATLAEENRAFRQKVIELEEQLAGGLGSSIHERAEIEKLRARIEILEEQNRELKQQGLDFKTTILAAQKFADNLRQTSEEDGKRMMEQARADVQRFREEAQAELSRLPQEIEKLNQQRIKVRDELRAILRSYLEALEIFPNQEEAEKEDDLSDLFQKIILPEDEATNGDDLKNVSIDLP